MGELEGTNTWGDPSRMRISDADRHRVAEVLRQAAGRDDSNSTNSMSGSS